MRALFIVVALFLAACSGGEAGSGALGPGALDDGGRLPDVVSAPPAADAAPNRVAYSFHYPPLTIQPGQEGVSCLDFKGPDHDVWVRGWHATTKMIHHVNISKRTSGTPFTVPTRCPSGAADVSTGVLGITQPDTTEMLDAAPEYRGVYMRLAAGMNLIWDVHYLNATAKPAEATIDIDFYEAEERITAVNGFSLSAARSLLVPPGVTQTLTYTCPSPASDFKLMSITAHVHAHNTATSVSVNGKEVYLSNDWASPLVKPFDSLHGGELVIKPTDKVTWSCTIANTTSSNLRWANEVNTGEMCIVYGLGLGPGWSCLI